MAEDFEFIKKRLVELASKAYASGIYTFTDFLGLEEQSAFSEIKKSISGIKYTAFGGADGAQRIILRFGDPEDLGYEIEFPIVVLRAQPKAQKWADKLTHRDVLGALMNLGIERDLLGDIVIRENEAFIFVHERVKDFICENFTKAKHTDLKVSVVDALPVGELFKTEEHTVQCVSPRADALVAKLFCLSREEALVYFKRGLVFIDGRQTENNSQELKEGQCVSVRTKGRFVYKGVKGLSKKGKLNVSLELYV